MQCENRKTRSFTTPKIDESDRACRIAGDTYYNHRHCQYDADTATSLQEPGVRNMPVL
ncbi:hypothetical protein C8R42DRAFT_669890 [Lentinula raphanica]|nr:hypothetical protein C8R42DRAFT_669890 [Lentinula raphanica]